ncbi:MAG: adenosylcobinamide-GDP ribazoletransferase [Chloroflexota bacterium]
MSFWLALQFLTIIPVPKTGEVDASKLGASLSCFPVVGLLLGFILFGLDWGLSYLFPPGVTAAVIVLVLAVLNGGHHLDGLADTCDGLVSGKTPDERLELMTRSGIGAFGATGICVILLLKFAALYSVGDRAAVLLMPVLSRWVVVGAILVFPYARASGMGTPYKQGVRWYHFLIATVIALAASLATFWLAGIAIMLLVWAIAYGVAALLKSKLGGLTGDSYGAIIEVSEVLILVLVIALMRWL